MEARPCTDSVFQLQDAQLIVEAKALYRLYRFVLVPRSSWNFKSSNYVADSRRRSKLKTVPKKSIISHVSHTFIISSDRLCYLHWCKSSLSSIAIILGSSWNFKLQNYVADCRRRSKLKMWFINTSSFRTQEQAISAIQVCLLSWRYPTVPNIMSSSDLFNNSAPSQQKLTNKYNLVAVKRPDELSFPPDLWFDGDDIGRSIT